jgi:uncharacterized membrane protein YhaH (DUF805 family)
MGMLASLFSFRGRTSRRNYWRIQLVLGAGLAAVWCAGLFLAISTGVGAISAVGLGGVALAIVGGWATVVRRLHDRNKSGWWLLLFYTVPLGAQAALGLGKDLVERHPWAAVATWFMAMGIAIWAFVELGLLKGTSGPNRFGADPSAPELEPAFTATIN